MRRTLEFPARYPVLLFTDRIGLAFLILGVILAAFYAFGPLEFSEPTTVVFATAVHAIFYTVVAFIFVCRLIRWTVVGKFFY